VITVRKRDQTGLVTWEYTGLVLARSQDFVRLEARFNRPDMPFQGTTLKRDDRFVETFYTNRWYNIFEIHDRDDDATKGWYCNVGHPARWDAPDVISYIDLALDLWVTPGGAQTVLDEDEFENMALDKTTRERALAALAELRKLFKSKQPTF
jgi:predicted RNA-binding protein associated with RNAse of E/G family